MIAPVSPKCQVTCRVADPHTLLGLPEGPCWLNVTFCASWGLGLWLAIFTATAIRFIAITTSLSSGFYSEK